ncbi:NADP-dependent glyceraldehyde-3-phosphate dehydrogenase [Williamsoniiplasma lucivorax]|uniref:Glyceraldehyde-3-phosphate dehydrogenase n=1 Tax=Williamsoniiplasma lucivorax TaxID=209274 RepID=A0A2S5RDP4_9MOLU|nr:NADP-dependent glyceraldehyde-3-phosphate dehydrogenase [Williamsoniiplasma lucivorax]PPE05441.1 glyceraldehyde-3-phosphate dehydrogenase [Williamsoniiplasma lucivorax]
MYKMQALINGQLIERKEVVEILNPTSLTIAGVVPALSAEDIKNAYQAAKNAQKSWEHLQLLERIKILNQWRDLIWKNKEELATIIMHEVAKAYKDALSEVERTIEYIDYTFQEAMRLEPMALTGAGMGVKNKYGIFERVAKGVGLAISPFNYPINLALAKIAPALVMGNTLVFKPATAGSLIGAKLGQLAHEAQIPAGVFNVVTGRGRDIGDDLTNNPHLNFISFTGSTKTGQHILQTASTKDVVLELGGKDPAIVLDDLKLDFYANEIISGAFSYSGQRCTAIKRVITTDAIADKIVPILKEKVEKLKVGTPQDNAQITPMIDQVSADFVLELIQDAKKQGAEIVTGDRHEKNLLWPTLIDHVTPAMKIAWEEPFGPVLPVLRINDLDQMIKVANDSNYGLQASIYTQNLNQAIHIAKTLEVGTININGKSQRGPDSFPFLGIKDSGVGAQGIHETLLSVTRLKGIVINY